MKSDDLRNKYLEFFKKRQHTIVPSAKLVPENDPTTLFTGSGMQPMVPYLLGQVHPAGTRIADSQKSFRTSDIEEVGDNRHTTFFEMLGNWSFGDYFHEEQLSWISKFLFEEVKIDPNKLFVTVFGGDAEYGLDRDTNAVEVWKRIFKEQGIDAKVVDIGSEENGYKVGMQGGRIFFYDSKKNWWSRAGIPEKMPIGEPGGPDSEMFYEFSDVEHNPKFGLHCHPNCDCGRYLEIGNNVFMQFVKVADKKFEPLPKKNIDFGGGLERISMAAQEMNDIIRLDIFAETIKTLEKLSGKSYDDPKYTAAFRVIADHLRASIFLIGDGVKPSNTDQGYFVRRLIRRSIRFWDKLGIASAGFSEMVDPIINYYHEAYPDTYAKRNEIKEEVRLEEEKFRKTLRSGLAQFEKLTAQKDNLSGTEAFLLFQSYGFPLELTEEIAKEKKVSVDVVSFKKEFESHQELSRKGAEQKFKGGLADHSEETTKLHTATHLLNEALRKVISPEIKQRGSNITSERLRFDFNFDRKLTPEEIKKVEDCVNEQIKKDFEVVRMEMPLKDALKLNAQAEFGVKYPDQVSVYKVGDFSLELCGGPHVKHTGELGHFKIVKEESVAAGIRRIKAVVE